MMIHNWRHDPMQRNGQACAVSRELRLEAEVEGYKFAMGLLQQKLAVMFEARFKTEAETLYQEPRGQ